MNPPSEGSGVAPRTGNGSGFGAMLRGARLRAGLTLADLAAQAGCDKSYLSRIENNRLSTAPSVELLQRLEVSLGVQAGQFTLAAQWQHAPAALRKHAAGLNDRARAVNELVAVLRSAAGGAGVGGAGGVGIGGGEAGRGGKPGASHGAARSLDALYQSGVLQRLIERVAPEEMRGVESVGTHGAAKTQPRGTQTHAGPAAGAARAWPVPLALPVEVPVINKVAAGYPREFTDLGYPARVADAYVRCPDLCDPDAFAARVCGDSMAPAYLEGDIVIFSPARSVVSGADCFVRLEPDHETTFKRVFFERGTGGEELIRLQPLNAAYPPKVVGREAVAGLYAAVSFMRGV